jgi:hypothetical protein
MIIKHLENGVEKGVKEIKPPSTTLSYTICLGAKYQSITSAMIKSLIEKGKWADDIVILCDSPITSLSYPNITFINITSLLNEIKFSDRTSRNAWFSKALLDKVINIQKYKNILFLDSDILIFKPIKEVLSKCSNEYIWTQYDGKGNPIPQLNKINSGVIYFSPQKFPNLLSDWRNQMPIYKDAKYADQDALKAAVKVGYNGKLEHFAIKDLDSKYKRESNTIVHYFHRHMGNFWKDYKEMNLC